MFVNLLVFSYLFNIKMDYAISLLKKIDIFAVPIKLKYLNKTHYKSSYGGFITIILFIILMILSLVLLIDLFEKKNQSIIKSYRAYSSPPLFKVNYDYQNETNNDINDSRYFFLAFSVFSLSDNTYLSISEIRKYFYISITYTDQTRSGSSFTRENENYDYALCNTLFSINNIYTNINLISQFDNYLCVNKNDYTLQGKFSGEKFQYVRIRIYPCSNSNNPYFDQCDNTKTSEDINNLEVNLIYSDYEFDRDKSGSNNIPISRILKAETVTINSLYSETINYLISIDQIASVEEIFTGTSSPNIFYPSTVYSKEFITTKFDDNYVSLYLRSSGNFIYFYRTYTTVVDIVALIGGLFMVVFIIGAIIVIPLNYKAMIMQMSNRLFNMIDPKNEEDINKEETYDNYLNKQKNNEDQPVIKTLNKTKLESEMSINLFKYERNKGVKISILNFFMNSLKELFASCFRGIKKVCLCAYFKNYGNKGEDTNREIKIRDNYLNDNQAIQNDNNTTNSEEEGNNISLIFDEAEKRINHLLEAKIVFRFTREIESIKRCIFKEKKFLLELGHRKVIHFENMNSIIEEMVNQGSNAEYYNPTEMALIKNNKFIEGLRGMKNKPILHPKFDLNLLSLIQFNMDSHSKNNADNNYYYLEKYFINQRSEITNHLDLKKKETEFVFEKMNDEE